MRVVAAAMAAFLGMGGAAAAAPAVATDIAPVHALAARVMQGVGEPALILPPGASPHGYAMRPSEARALEGADVVFWIGPGLAPWFGEAIAALAPDALSVALRDAPGVTLLPIREGARFEPHDHGAHGDDHGHDAHGHKGHGHDDHGHDEHAHDDHGHDDHAHDDHGHDDHGHDDHDHAHGDEAKAHAAGHGDGHADEHIWLDPENARAFVAAMAEALAARDPANAETYRANAAAADAELAALTGRLAAALAPVADRPFLVFHDAYQYFEARFGLQASGALTLSDAAAPTAARLQAVRAVIAETGARCVFSEPQFSDRILAVVTEGSEARTGRLDPLGAELTPGPDLYAATLQGMADSFIGCLTP